MPALPSVPGVIKSVLKFVDGAGNNMANILHWGFTGADTLTLLTNLGIAIGDKWVADMLPVQSNSYTFDGIEMVDLSSDTAPSTEIIVSEPGGLSGAPLPASAAMVIGHDISRRYRGGHPRTYLGGMVQSYLENNTDWVEGDYTGIAADFADFISDVITAAPSGLGTVSAVNVSYYTDHALRAVPVVDPINSYIGHPRVCSQRRRLGKLGG